MSLTNRILISLGLMALAGFYVLLDPILDRVERQYLEAIEEPMVDAAEILAALLSHQSDFVSGIPDAWVGGMKMVNGKKLNAQIYNLMKVKVMMDFYVTDGRGIVIYDSGDAAKPGDDFSIYLDVLRTLNGKYGARSTRLNEEDPTSSIMYVGAPIMKDDEIVGVLSVYKPQRSMLLFILETKEKLLKLGVTALLLVLALGWLLSKWVTYPLKRLTQYAAAVARGERPKAPVMPGYHLRLLGETTEAMRDALEDRKYVESYVQSMTHEMKSPLAGICGAAELLEEDLPAEKRGHFLRNIKAESVRLQNLVDQLLALSSLENRTELGAPSNVSLADLIRRLVDQHESNALSRGIRFEMNCPDELTVLGEEFLLEMALNNLIQNAIDFSLHGGLISISVIIESQEVHISISDEGPGIPEYAVERIFDRFYSLPRPGSEQKSSGLGLCYAREAIELHGGQLTLKNRTDRAGVLAEIVLS